VKGNNKVKQWAVFSVASTSMSQYSCNAINMEDPRFRLIVCCFMHHRWW